MALEMAAQESGIAVVSTRWAAQHDSLLRRVSKTQRWLPIREYHAWWRTLYRRKKKLGATEKELLICHNVVTCNTGTVRKALRSLTIFWFKDSMVYVANSRYMSLLPPGKNSQFIWIWKSCGTENSLYSVTKV